MKVAEHELTDAMLRAAKPSAKGELKLRDRRTPGLVFRARAHGRPTFLLEYTFGGRRKKIALGYFGARSPALTLAAARVAAARERARIREGIDPAAEREAKRTAARKRTELERAAARGEPRPGSFAALAKLYLAAPERAAQREESRREYERKVARELLPAWGDRQAGEIRRADVYALGSAIASGEGARRRWPGRPAPVAASNLLKLASAIFNFGLSIDFPGLIGNPCHGLRRRIAPARPPRERVLSPDEIRRLWEKTENLAPSLRAIPRLLLLTGCRRDELLGARWSEIEAGDLGTWLEVPAERMKGGRAARVPLSSLAREELERLAAAGRDPEFLFPGRFPGRPLREAFFFRKRLLESMGGKPWTWHDLRRTARTLLAQARVSETAAELFLSHVPPALRGVAGAYNRHDYAREREEAAEALAARVRAILAGDAGKVLPFVNERSPA